MSRSFRKPIARISASVTQFMRRRWRHKVKQELKKPNPSIPIIETDVKKSGLANLGTWFGWPSAKICNADSDWDINEKKKLSRK